MTVKDRVGRVRYVAFRVPGAPRHRGDVAGQLQPPRKLTRFDGSNGIAKTTHLDRDALVEKLRTAGFEPLATSGTIRAAAQALPAGCEAAKRTPRPPRGTEKPQTQSPSGRARLK